MFTVKYTQIAKTGCGPECHKSQELCIRAITGDLPRYFPCDSASNPVIVSPGPVVRTVELETKVHPKTLLRHYYAKWTLSK